MPPDVSNSLRLEGRVSPDELTAAFETFRRAMGEGPSMTVDELIAWYTVARQEKHKKGGWSTILSALRIVSKHVVNDRSSPNVGTRLGARRISSLTHDDMDEFIQARMKEGVSRQTAAKNLHYLSSAIGAAVKRRKLAHNPLRGYEYDAPAGERDRAYTSEEVDAILDSASRCGLSIVRAVVMIMRRTGIRPAELMGMKRAWINWGNGLTRIPGSLAKSGKERFCVIFSDGLDACRDLAPETAEWLLPSPRLKGRPVSAKCLYDQWIKATQVACISPDEDGSPPELYSMRGTLATRLALEHGYELHQLMNAMGWTSPNQARKYVRSGERQILEQALRLQELERAKYEREKLEREKAERKTPKKAPSPRLPPKPKPPTATP